MKPTWGLLYWPAFIYAVAILFLGPEVYAFFTNDRNTLSDFAWYELGISGTIDYHHPAWWISLIATVVFLGMLIGHIWFKTPS
jgi:hypothetical protein